MALGALQFHAVDDAGNVLAEADVTIRKEVAGAPLADLYQDRDGQVPLANPTATDGDGFLRVFAPGGSYRVDVVSGDNTVTLRYVPVGTAQELDFDGEPYVPGGEPVAIGDGGTGASTAEEAFANLKQAATTDSAGVVAKATTGEVAAATADKYIAADHLQTASAAVALSDGATVAVDWKASAANFSLTVAGDRTVGNPTNGIPGTWRSIIVQGNDATERTITFGSNYGGEVPEITDCSATQWYEIIIRCVTTTHFIASARDASPPT